MTQYNIVYILLFLTCLLSSCHHGKKKSMVHTWILPVITLPVEKPVDTLLTDETRALWLNLKKMQGKGILFGQQDATTSGVDWK